jgi:glycerol-3-phosphate O-acyltransferase
MLALRSIFYLLLKFPIQLLVRCKIVPDTPFKTHSDKTQPSDNQPIFYVVRHQSASDLLTLQKACKQKKLPDPLSNVNINGQLFPRTFCLEKPSSLFSLPQPSKTSAITQGAALLNQHTLSTTLDAQLIPANMIWGRKPTKEKRNASVGTVLADQESPNMLRKFFIVLFLGRNTLVRFSEPLSFRYMVEQHGSNEKAAHKLMRITRFHFHRQTIAAKGPRLMHRKQMFLALFANPAVRRVITEEAKSKAISEQEAKKQALKMMTEIAGDYSDAIVRLGERILHWLWHRVYSGIEVKNADMLRTLAQEGHEIIYVPCHRSHMDYLLLTYVIFNEGLVTPRIAAGINLNFWPAGPIFRKAGAFFIRRSFAGNRLYSTIFREYLGLLFERGYSVKYYAEGGRSRTGRILPPKTGMLAMTIQSLLRGIDRPLTLVPVYIGYEHVMEVGTYHKELSGSQKKKESILGVFKAIRNLRNYGKGFVNFGEPININQFLNKEVPEWKNDIDEIDPKKPNWLTPTVNLLANNVMTAVNQSAALNGVALVALIIHTTDNKALSRVDLEAQLNFFLMIQNQAPYSKQLTIPMENGSELLAHVITLGKVTVTEDSFGDIISLTASAALEMRYYRNNILHVYILPALICRLLERTAKIAKEELLVNVQRLMLLIKNDLFLWQSKEIIEQQVSQTITALIQADIAKESKAGFISITDNTEQRSKVRALGECVNETMQRFAIITSLVNRLAPVSKTELENKVVAIAKRLSVLNNINAPEFIDNKAQATLINAMKTQGYIGINEEGEMVANSTLEHIRVLATKLVDLEVLQSIAR